MLNITLSRSRWRGVSAERHCDVLGSCSRHWSCPGQYPADLTRQNIVAICNPPYVICKVMEHEGHRPEILTKLLSLMDPEARRNLNCHFYIGSWDQKIYISRYFQFNRTPGLCCRSKPLPGACTIILPEGFPPKLTVQDLQSSHVMILHCTAVQLYLCNLALNLTLLQ